MNNLNIQANSTIFSLNNATALAIASQLAYKSEKEIRTFLAEEGFNAEFINEQNTDTQLFIAHNSSTIIIAFRGTTDIRDWLTNAGIDFRVTVHGRVHKGFDRALDSVWKQISLSLQKIQHNSQSLWITGHSLGGALAVLASARLCLDIDQDIYKPVNGLYTFGQPRVGDRSFVKTLDEEIKPRYFRFVNDNDIVPRVPDRLNQYQEGGSMRFFDASGKLHEDISFWFAFLESIKGSYQQKLDLIPSFIEHHFIDKYIANIKKNTP